ncbi:MAG: GGDEF domain-containing protein, partial [Pseudomonadota bacterium]
VSIDVAPRARELQRVTRAINSLSAKIRDAISLETTRAERLRREAFEDSMTGQLNRRGFDNAVSAALAKSAEVHSGALTLFSIGGLDEINRAVGLTKGNEVLSQFSDMLADSAKPFTAFVGRWQGPTFAAFVANESRDMVTAWVDGVCESFVATLRVSGLPQSVGVCAGFAHFSVAQATLAVLSRLAEAALAQAATRGSGTAGVDLETAGGQRLDMKSEIEMAVSGGRVSLLFQKVASIADDSVLQFEFLARLVDSHGEAISAGAFVPVASQHGLLPALDLRVVELALAALARAMSLPRTISVNVAMQSILDQGFRSGLRQLLKDKPREAQRMVFEMTGASASKSPEVTKSFARELAGFGSKLALDNFEMDRYAVALVHDLMPAYVKLAPVFTREIGAQSDARFVLEAMQRVFRPLEIPLIAQGVEDSSLIAVLAEIGVVGYQGFALGRPEPLTE